MYEAALILSVICLLLVCFAFWRSPAFSIFHPLAFYIPFHALVFVFRPIIVWAMDYKAIYIVYQFTPSPTEKLTALIAANIGFLSFAFFSLRSGNVAMQFRQDSFSEVERRRLKTVFLGVLAICVPIGGYSMLSFWNDVSAGTAYAGMMRDAHTGTFVSTTGNGYLLEAQLMLASSAALFAWVYRFRLWAIAPILVFVVLRAGTGGRGPFIAAMVMVGLLYFYEKKLKMPSIRAVALALVLLAGFNSIGSDRGLAIRQAMGFEESLRGPAVNRERFMEGMDFGNLEFLEYVIYVVPKRSGTYDYFVDNLQLLTEPIPRALWPNKPIGPPIIRFNLMDYGFPVGITRSLPGEGWHAMGWIGVIIWCGLWGYLLGLIYRKFAEGPQNTLHLAAYMIFLPMMIVAYRDGLLTSIFRQGLFFMTPVIVWALIARYRKIPTAQAMRIFAFNKARKRRLAEASETGTVTGPVAGTVPQKPTAQALIVPRARRRQASTRRPAPLR